MSIAGEASRAVLSHCSHVRMEAKRSALDEIAACQRAADERRHEAPAMSSACLMDAAQKVRISALFEIGRAHV